MGLFRGAKVLAWPSWKKGPSYTPPTMYRPGKSNVKLRTYLLKKRGRQCFYCLRTCTPPVPLGERHPPSSVTIEHLVPQCEGGSNHISNLVIACRECNTKFGAMIVRPMDLSQPVQMSSLEV